MKKVNDIESVYSQYVNDLFTYAAYLGFDHHVIMDAIHDVFCKLAASENSLDEVENVKFYLFASLKNRLYDIHKSKREHVSIDTFDENPFDIHVNIEDDLIDLEERNLIKQQIEQMLNSLTARQREVIYLRYVQEYDYSQIAKLLNISIHGCRKLVSKAMQSLREKYGPTGVMLLLSFGSQMLKF